MDFTEQIAEKIVAWSAHGLMEHYVDVAWAFYRLPDQIDTTKLGRLVDAKLDVGRELFPIPYAAFPGRTALRPALEHPDDHVPPQGDAADDKASQLRFAQQRSTSSRRSASCANGSYRCSSRSSHPTSRPQRRALTEVRRIL